MFTTCTYVCSHMHSQYTIDTTRYHDTAMVSKLSMPNIIYKNQICNTVKPVNQDT